MGVIYVGKNLSRRRKHVKFVFSVFRVVGLGFGFGLQKRGEWHMTTVRTLFIDT